MTAPDPDDDLLDQLRAVAHRLDPPPELLGEFARAALGWRTLDAELAELAYDSAADVSLVDALRSTAHAPRLLTFSTDEVTVELEVTARGGERRLVGQVVPMQPAQIEIRHGSGVTTADSDVLGRFDAEGLPAGPVSLLCRLQPDAGGRVVRTDWSTI